MKTIAYFVSGHGYGHGVRSCAIINGIPSENRILIFSALPEAFFREELKVKYRHISCELDGGCVQSGCAHIDVPATLKKYAAINMQREKLIDHYAGLIKKAGVDLILADIPPLAFPIAAKAGVPGIGISNFSWADIYQPYLKRYPGYSQMIEQIMEDYGKADNYFSLYPNMEGKGLHPQEEMGLVSRKGKRRRGELVKKYKLNPEKKWCLVYAGPSGLEEIQWEQLKKYPGWEFLGLYALPGAPENYHLLEKRAGFNYADFTVSCDLVFGKLGYGLVSECLSHGTTVIFMERFDFAEYPVLKAALTERGQGVEISLEKARRLDFHSEMEKLIQNKFEPLEARGSENIVRALGL